MRLKPGVNGSRMSRPCFHCVSYDARTSHGLGSCDCVIGYLLSRSNKVRLRLTYGLKCEADGSDH